MEKAENDYETYEYFPSSNVESESDQFFVVQDNGTFLLNRQVQYVAQVEDVKETLAEADRCTGYDVNPQQFFVNVTENPGELISVADNYILPSPEQEGDNNVYSNSFLLQSVTPQSSEEEAKGLSVMFKPQEENVINVDEQGNNCTEITLSDEQYKTLEQKGWVYLNACDKIYLLDSFGLHDITDNQELIQNLKAESQVDNTVNTTPSIFQETKPPLKLEVGNDSLNVNQEQQETIDQLDVGSEKENIEENTQINVVDEEEDKSTKNLENPKESVEHNIVEENSPANSSSEEYNVDKIKIVTKCIFKDIPDKVVLGKTTNGKRLVAKVVKRKNGPDKCFQQKPDKQAVLAARKVISEDYNSECSKVFQLALCGEIEASLGEDEATKMIHQLAQVASVRASIDGRNVIITKALERTVDGVPSTHHSFVTGFVTSVQGTPKFVHVPDLLHKLIRDTEDSSNRSLLKCQQTPGDHKILQVHVSESKRDDAETVSVVLNDQVLPNKCGMPKRLSRLHACSSCAAIFLTEEELANHQENHAMDAEDTLTIDTARLPKATQGYTENTYFTIKTDKGTVYGCLQCPKKFTKLIKYLRHKTVHEKPKKQDSDKEGEMQINVMDPPFKCTMCSDYNSECSKVFQLALCGEIEASLGEDEATKMIHQLAQVASVRASIDGRNVIITKALERTVDGVPSTHHSFVTGFVTSVQGTPKFVHVPDLLHKLIRDTEDSSNRSLLKCQQTPGDHKILQVHVSETKRDDAETVSVVLNDQVLPNKCGMPKRLSRLHACSSCAAIFLTEEELANHQENHAMDAEDTLTIDTARLPKATQGYTENTYFTIKTDKGTVYGCLQCPKKFTKLIKYLRHKTVHEKPKKQDSDKEGEMQINVMDPPFKCTMCSGQYYYAASLSKHICKVHITNNVRKVIQAPYLISWQP